jgi:hypothetical protein
MGRAMPGGAAGAVGGGAKGTVRGARVLINESMTGSTGCN